MSIPLPYSFYIGGIVAKCVHKISSPKTTIVWDKDNPDLKQFHCFCTECKKEILFEKLPEKLKDKFG
jgi:hypothetical protein